ncbi:MAG: sugar phosphate isomerase/epimerase [Clostridia bacterium]|nr:sugar phosphate isomerase/epimerase [Clostridia bacterium]
MITDKFGIQMFSLRRSFDANAQKTLESVAKMGYKGVEAAGLGCLSPSEYKAICDELGLEIYSAHLGENDLTDEKFGETVDMLSVLGCKRAVLAWIKTPDSLVGVTDACNRLNKYAEMLCSEGIEFHFHNHDGEMKTLDGEKSILEQLIEGTSEKVYFELDTGWCNFGGGDSCDIISRYADRIKLIHLKQIKSQNERITTEFENGKVIDVSQIVSVCKKVGIDHFIVEQDNSDDEMLSAKMNADYLLQK